MSNNDEQGTPMTAAVEPPTLEQVVLAVLAWQRAHPLAKRLGPEAVHSVGWVALPFLRGAQGETSLAPRSFWQKALDRMLRRSPPPAAAAVAAFSEAFIDGVKPSAAAAFALRHGIDALPAGDDWPQRRIAVDGNLASTDAAGWPFERWIASAALDGPNGRRRVLVAARTLGEKLPVMGRRHWDTPRLIAVGALLALGVAILVWALQTPKPSAPEVRVAGAVLAASGVPMAQHAAASAAASPASVAASSTVLPASEAASGQATPMEPAASQIASSSPRSVSAEESPTPRIDIRPRLGPMRDGDKPRPPIRGGNAQAPANPSPANMAGQGPAAMPTAIPSAKEASASTEGKPTASTAPAGTQRLELRSTNPTNDTIALVSKGYPQRAEAQAMLTRMQEHLRSTLGPNKAVEGAVFESPQGYRAAVWPFSSREEAQVLNATMIARGWRTRAVNF